MPLTAPSEPKVYSIKGLTDMPDPTDVINVIRLRSKRGATHIGELSNHRQTTASHEGCLLSASNCPDAWGKIARIGGKEWRIRHSSRDLKLIHMLHAPTRKALNTWGLQHGLLELETWWWTPCGSDEEGAVRYCWTKNPNEEEWEDTGKKPKEKEIPIPAKELFAFWHQRLARGKHPKIEPWHATDAVAAAVVCKHIELNPGNPQLDGLVWEETLDPYALSAPRMGIVPHNNLEITPA